LLPQHTTAPLARTAQLWIVPTATATASLMPATGAVTSALFQQITAPPTTAHPTTPRTARSVAVVIPETSVMLSPLPQHCTVPLVRRAHMASAPPASCVTFSRGAPITSTTCTGFVLCANDPPPRVFTPRLRPQQNTRPEA
jgi:uncharacterized membrane protein YraQ (UPF0718 family)